MNKSLFRSQCGAAVTEFGLIAPTLMLLVIGTMDMGHGYYVRTVLNGALRDAARESSLEAASAATVQTSIDLKIRQSVAYLIPSADIEVERRYYKTFSKAAAAQAEPIINDENNNSECDPDEQFLDQNNNGFLDLDGGDSGQGGARDIVIIQVVVKYNRLFPLDKFLGVSDGITIISDSILANQPYGQQQQYGAPTPTDCP